MRQGRRLRKATRICLLLLLFATPVAAEKARVRSVTDGDTLVVEDRTGKRQIIRLIGVDTPESRHPGRPPEYLAKEATEFVKAQAEGKRVRLEKDPEADDRDAYDRLLRYVYLPDGEMLNALLIRQGYGYAYTRFPFTKAGEFRELEEEARAEGLGVWAAGGMAELRWTRDRGTGAFAVYPMTNRHWAIAYGDHVKMHVPSNQLVRQLNRLLELMAKHEGEELVRALEANGYVVLQSERD